MKLLKLTENKPIKEYEKEWETQKGYKTCDNCGTRLNDGGTCPKCDDGEEDMDESLGKNSRAHSTKSLVKMRESFMNELLLVDNIAYDIFRYQNKSVEDMTADELKEDLLELFSKVLEEQSRRKAQREEELKSLNQRKHKDDIDYDDIHQLIRNSLNSRDTNESLKESAHKCATKVVNRLNEDYVVDDRRVDSFINDFQEYKKKYIEEMSEEELKRELMELIPKVLGSQSRKKTPMKHEWNDEDREEFKQSVLSHLDDLERKGLLGEGVENYATKEVTPCCICKRPIEGYGNNAEPVCKGTCCDECNREKVIPARINKFRGGLTESYNKVDEDTANEIALMAMRAMHLKEHEAQALEYDLIEGKADKWIKDFEALPDDSEVKKLFFTFVKKSTNESYDPKDFNIDARTPFDDEMEKIYKPLATAIKEERWEDAAKEYWELKNEFDAELQSVSKKPIIGKLFKLMAIPHTNALNNYKKSIPAEYLEGKDKKNESLGVGAGLALGGAAIGAGIAGSSLMDSLDNDEDEMNELLDIKVDAKGFGGSGNNVHVGPGSIPLTSSFKKGNGKIKKDYDDDFDLTVY